MSFFFVMRCRPPTSTLFPYTTLFRSHSTRSRRPPISRESAPGRASIVVAGDWRPEINFVSLRSEEHTSELQSHSDLVCRLLLEKKKQNESRRHGGNQSSTAERTMRTS